MDKILGFKYDSFEIKRTDYCVIFFLEIFMINIFIYIYIWYLYKISIWFCYSLGQQRNLCWSWWSTTVSTTVGSLMMIIDDKVVQYTYIFLHIYMYTILVFASYFWLHRTFQIIHQLKPSHQVVSGSTQRDSSPIASSTSASWICYCYVKINPLHSCTLASEHTSGLWNHLGLLFY